MAESQEKIIVYGVGNYFARIQEELQEKYKIIAYADQYARKEIRGGGNVISLGDALKYHYDRILITILSIKVCFDVIEDLIYKYKVKAEKIILGNYLLYEKGEISYYLSVNKKGEIVFHHKDLAIATRNIDEFNNVYEIYTSNCYSYFLQEREEVVLDIGMNIGGAALYFATKSQIKKIYGYEPFLRTYLQAKSNIEWNKGYCKKINCYHYGIGDRTESRDVIYNVNMSCGQSSITEKNSYARENYKNWDLISSRDDKTEKIDIKDIREVLEDVKKVHKQEDIILKLDCEGEEYGIFRRLDECDLFKEISMIMMEWHYDGSADLIRILKKHGFAFWEFIQTSNTGLIYAVNMKKRNR